MARKTTIDRQQIIDEGIRIIREDGLVALNARKLAEHLGITTTPIFKNFGSMSKLITEIWNQVKKEFDDYLLQALDYEPVFKEFGLLYLKFAFMEPNLFRFLFLVNDENCNLCRKIDKSNMEIFSSIERKITETFKINDFMARELLHAMRVFTCGMAMMSLNEQKETDIKACCLMLTNCAQGILEQMKKQKDNICPDNFSQLVTKFDGFPKKTDSDNCK